MKAAKEKMYASIWFHYIEVQKKSSIVRESRSGLWVEGGKSHKEIFACDGYFVILVVVMVACVHTHAKLIKLYT